MCMLALKEHNFFQVLNGSSACENWIIENMKRGKEKAMQDGAPTCPTREHNIPQTYIQTLALKS